MPEKPPITLATPIQYARGVGEVRAREFLELGIKTCGDLLFYMPRDFLQFADEAPVAAMQVGQIATVRGTILQTQLIRRPRARLVALLQDEAGGAGAEHVQGAGNPLEAGRCTLTWFNPYDLAKKILPGTLVRATGKVTMFRNRMQIVQPKVEILREEQAEAVEKKQARMEPVYPATQELSSAAIGRIVAGMIEAVLPEVEEWFAEGFLRERHFFTKREALRQIHRPDSLKNAVKAKRTLAYHEFFLHQGAMALKRYQQRNSVPAVPLRVDEAVDGRIRALLPFAFTPAQERVIGELRGDLAGTKPMNRLLQGDVGSGKTVVALYAMLAACATRRGETQSAKRETQNGADADAGTRRRGDAAKGKFETRNSKLETPATQSSALSTWRSFHHQAALMAPTEILAEQHFITLSRLLEGKKVRITLLTGSVKGAERRRALAEIADGTVGIVIGTHALVSEGVEFHSLALVVIDEQHKFGVEQRSLLRAKPAASGIAPHVLVMTATPIPRTLAMTAFGDLNVSVIDELPPGRRPVFTRMTPASNREEVYAWLAGRLKEKEQAFIVVPRIDEMVEDAEFEGAPEAETQDAKLKTQNGEGASDAETRGQGDAANQKLETQNSKLKTDITQSSALSTQHSLLGLRNAVGVQRELQGGVLRDFRVGLLHGRMERETRQHIMERFRQGLIDALVSTTVIEVGVDVPNASVMVIENADRFGLSQLHQLRGRVGRGERQSRCILLGDLSTDDGIARLQAMVKFSSGFKIAEEDLRLRGMGQLIGTAQSGRTDLHFAELLLDPVLLPLSRRDAFNLVAADPRLLAGENVTLRRALLERFSDSISLVDVG